MKFRTRIIFCLLIIFPCLHISAQYSEASTKRFFSAIQPNFSFVNLKFFNQQTIDSLRESNLKDLIPLDSAVSKRLLRDSHFLQPDQDDIFYYAYNEPYGEYYQIILCAEGDYAPTLVLLNYSIFGELLGETNLAGSFIDGGEAYVWKSELKNGANLVFTYNSYSDNQGKGFYCDSVVTNYAIQSHGSMKILSEKKYRGLTDAIGGIQSKILTDSQNLSKVFAPSGLKLRRELGRKSNTIEIIPYGAEVDVVQVTEEKYATDWVRGNWAYVKYDTLEGYVFDGFLSTFSAPNIDNPKLCQGNYAVLLRDYVRKYFENISEVDTELVRNDEADIYRMEFTQFFGDSLRLTTSQTWEGYNASLEIPETTVEEVYILLVAMLSTCSDTEELKDQLLFVKNRRGEIYKIYDREGRVLIKKGVRRHVSLSMNYLPALDKKTEKEEEKQK